MIEDLIGQCLRLRQSLLKYLNTYRWYYHPQKLNMSVLFTDNIRSFIKILNNKGPRIEPWGTPFSIRNQELKNDPTFVL